MTKYCVFTLLFFGLNLSFAQERVVEKYVKRQRVDLGNMEIEGEVLTPGDLSIQGDKRKRFRMKLYDRENFKYEIRNDVLNLR